MASSPFFTEDERRAWAPFVIGVLHLLSTLDRELKASFDISHLDYGILMLLSHMPERIQRMTMLAATFGVDPSNITYRARRMESQRLVERCTDATDGRVVCLRLTDEGLALLRKAQLVHVQAARRHFLAHLEPGQLSAIEAIFGNLRSIQQPLDEYAFMEQSLPASE
jgi:DNA-binding MarR family transcriptional regulator